MHTLGMKSQAADRVLINEFSNKFDAVKFRETARSFERDYFSRHGVPEKDGLYTLLDYLKSKNYKLAVASSTSEKTVYHHLNEKNITAYFDAVICGDMVKNSKPEPDIYLKACRALDEQPENCVAVEDSRNGLLSAHRAGCRVIMVPDLWQGEPETDALLFAKCESLRELINIL